MTGEKPGDSGKNDAIDVNSPYYIHPSDLPKQMHVNEVLTDGNYSDWAKEMANFLFAKNKMGFVDETKPVNGLAPTRKTPEKRLQKLRFSFSRGFGALTERLNTSDRALDALTELLTKKISADRGK
ncbi:hypothetical protein OSB04_006300 [Centaurea solstitialis]|uniref:Retrotransposon Copia-like N-terminal domain-containing protein n=1 Tax=Centaurea solstitialis TaxID=347529 RepID=A0AA38WQ84_9ASTR|nr:hypothetical protein OSB04_006300 [Centaurea solstitialis]